MKNTHVPKNRRHGRWLLWMNIAIATLLIGAAGVLKTGSARYQPQAQFDRNYIAQTQAETDTVMLKRGLVYTEAARATAYKSVMNVSHGASLTWLIIAVAFVLNAVFVFRMSRRLGQVPVEQAC